MDPRLDTLCSLAADQAKFSAEQAKLLAEHTAILNKCVAVLGKPIRPRDKYCYTHGLASHTSKECNRRCPDHKEEATFRNRMGGSTRGIE